MLIIIQLSTSVPWVPILCSLPFYLCWLRVRIFLQVILIQWDCKSEMFKERKERHIDRQTAFSGGKRLQLFSGW